MKNWIKLSEKIEAYGNRYIYEVPADEVYTKIISGGPCKGETRLVTDVINQFGVNLGIETVQKRDNIYIVEQFHSIGD